MILLTPSSVSPPAPHFSQFCEAFSSIASFVCFTLYARSTFTTLQIHSIFFQPHFLQGVQSWSLFIPRTILWGGLGWEMVIGSRWPSGNRWTKFAFFTVCPSTPCITGTWCTLETLTALLLCSSWKCSSWFSNDISEILVFSRDFIVHRKVQHSGSYLAGSNPRLTWAGILGFAYQLQSSTGVTSSVDHLRRAVDDPYAPLPPHFPPQAKREREGGRKKEDLGKRPSPSHWLLLPSLQQGCLHLHFPHGIN